MRIAYLDCFSGLSGDMFLGAAVDAGVPFEELAEVARGLGVGAELQRRKLKRGGLSATKIDVLIGGRADEPLDHQEHSHETHSHEHAPAGEVNEHTHEHTHDGSTHEHVHAHPHEHEHEHHHAHEQGHEHGLPQKHADEEQEQEEHGVEHEHKEQVHRGLAEIRPMIAAAPIGERAKKFALRAFELLAEAEGKVHGRDAEAIHFHEVGSEDAIVDIVCSAVAVELIGAEQWYSSSLNVGGGMVRCAHGLLPVPAPATAELLRGMPVFSSGVQKELLTPTGAALLRALEVKFEPLPALAISATGYGAGARELPSTPNVVRLMLGEATAMPVGASSPQDASEAQKLVDQQVTDTVAVLEANIDDMNPQLFGYVQQKLLEAGALDAFGVPVQMKKGRPGMILTVLATPAGAEELCRILLRETTTLGVRMRNEARRILQREHVVVNSTWGPIRIKLGLWPNGEVANCAPEFEDCRAIAEAAGIPLKKVLQEALRLYTAARVGSHAASSAGSNPAANSRTHQA